MPSGIIAGSACRSESGLVVQRVFLAGRGGLAGLLGASLLVAAAAPALSEPPHPSSPHRAAPAAARAAHTRAVEVDVENAWIPQPPPGAEVAAAYFTLRNAGGEPAVLVSVDCPLAAAAMLHRSSIVAGQSRMRMVERLTIPPEHSVRLEPGGLHVMLHELARPLAVGQRVPLVLHFAGGKALHVEATVRPLGSR